MAARKGSSGPPVSPAAEVPVVHPLWGSRAAFAAVLALTAVLRVYVALQPQAIHVDGAFQYVPAARTYYEAGLREGLGLKQMPLYPVATALVAHLTGGRIERAARLVSLLAGIVAVIPLWLLGRTLFGRRIAGLSALLYAVAPLMVKNSSEVTKEAFFTCLLLWGLWMGWLAVTRRRPGLCLTAGLLGALTYLARPDGIVLMIVWGIWLGAGAMRHLFRNRRLAVARLAAGGLILAPWLAVAGPYLLHLRLESGRWTLSMKKSPRDVLHERETRQAERRKRRAVRRGRTYAPPRTTALVRLGRAASSVREILRETWNELSPALFLLLVVGLLVRGRRRLRPGDLYLVLTCAIIFAAAYLIARNTSVFRGARLLSSHSNFSGRHILAMLLAAWFWLAFGLTGLARLLTPAVRAVLRYCAGAVGTVPVERIAGALGLTLVLAACLPRALEAPHADKLSRRDAGLWLRAHGAPNPRIVTHARRIAYYAGVPRRPNIVAPSDDWLHELDLWVRRARKRDARYLAILSKEMDDEAIRRIEALVRRGEIRFVHRTGFRHREDVWLYEVAPRAGGPQAGGT